MSKLCQCEIKELAERIMGTCDTNEMVMEEMVEALSEGG